MSEMTLGQKQRHFTRMVGLLIEFAYQNGYELTVGAGGQPGASIARNGYALTIISGNDTTRIKGPIS